MHSLNSSITILTSFYYMNYLSAKSSYIWIWYFKISNVRCVTGAEHRAFGVKRARLSGLFCINFAPHFLLPAKTWLVTIASLAKKSQHFEKHMGF